MLVYFLRQPKYHIILKLYHVVFDFSENETGGFMY